MDDKTRAEYEAKCQHLRADLKRWETSWAKENGGKKPARDDIKRNPELGMISLSLFLCSWHWYIVLVCADILAAQKYKNYQKCRDILDGKAPVPSRKRKPADDTAARPSSSSLHTPSKRSRHVETPSKGPLHAQHLDGDDDVETPTSRKLFSPTAVNSVGPTPQRDGRVLGLFDLLEEDTPRKQLHATPSRRNTTAASGGAGGPGSTTTPSRKRAQPPSDADSTPRRTPMSASKRQYLNTFIASPSSRAAAPVGSLTPSSSNTPSKLHFATPQFLKRHSTTYNFGLDPVDENGEPAGASADVIEPVPPLRLPRKPLGRGLSEIVASLRKEEDDQADQDLEALREMEMEMEMEQQRENEGDQPPEEPEAPVIKKKGQKRTTRKVNIKPTWIKRPDQNPSGGSTQQGGGGGEGEASDDEDQASASRSSFPRTQPAPPNPDDDYLDQDDDESDVGDSADTKSKAKAKPRTKPAPEKSQDAGPVKKAARKVNELAHANFHRLKLRQGGAKGGPGYNSRFRRRR